MLAARPLGADVEVDRPHRDAAGERDQECGNRGRVPRQLGEGRAGDQDRFAERDDDEEPAALCDMSRPRPSSRSCSNGRGRAPRKQTIGEMNSIDKRERPDARAASGASAKAPAIQNARRGSRARGRCAMKLPVVRGVVEPEHPQHEPGASKLHDDIGERERRARDPRRPAGSSTTARARRASARTASAAPAARVGIAASWCTRWCRSTPTRRRAAARRSAPRRAA